MKPTTLMEWVRSIDLDLLQAQKAILYQVQKSDLPYAGASRALDGVLEMIENLFDIVEKHPEYMWGPHNPVDRICIPCGAVGGKSHLCPNLHGSWIRPEDFETKEYGQPMLPSFAAANLGVTPEFLKASLKPKITQDNDER